MRTRREAREGIRVKEKKRGGRGGVEIEAGAREGEQEKQSVWKEGTEREEEEREGKKNRRKRRQFVQGEAAHQSVWEQRVIVSAY